MELTKEFDFPVMFKDLSNEKQQEIKERVRMRVMAELTDEEIKEHNGGFDNWFVSKVEPILESTSTSLVVNFKEFGGKYAIN